MNHSTAAVHPLKSSARSRVRDYIELTKPRISVMVLFTVAAAGYAASTQADWNGWGILHAVVGTFLVAASGSALNQYLERWFDARMKRTSKRPLPSRRLSAMEGVTFATITVCSGLVYLLQTVGWVPCLLGLATWVLYVWIYTPLKRVTWFNTVVGAVSGALPILIGWTATTGEISVLGWSMFGVLFLWQFPHFMAIAWMYRGDYADGEMKMLPVVDPSGKTAGIEAVVCALTLIPVSLLPWFTLANCPWWFVAITLITGLVYLAYSVVFLVNVSDRTARFLLRVSLLYLPLYYGTLMLTI